MHRIKCPNYPVIRTWITVYHLLKIPRIKHVVLHVHFATCRLKWLGVSGNSVKLGITRWNCCSSYNGLFCPYSSRLFLLYRCNIVHDCSSESKPSTRWYGQMFHIFEICHNSDADMNSHNVSDVYSIHLVQLYQHIHYWFFKIMYKMTWRMLLQAFLKIGSVHMYTLHVFMKFNVYKAKLIILSLYYLIGYQKQTRYTFFFWCVHENRSLYAVSGKLTDTRRP